MRIIAVASILTFVLLLLLPFGYQTVWDGKFDLAIVIIADKAIEESSLRLATCWNEADAVHASQNPDDYDSGFRTARILAAGELVIDVPCSGRVNAYGMGSTYNHPKFLVAEYRLSNNSEQPVRKLFIIPDGRGSRTKSVVLP